jgi:hypothetical protein
MLRLDRGEDELQWSVMPATWQQSNIHAAASYLRERIASGAEDPRIRAVYEGLLDVLDPPRRTIRRQRDAATIATIGVERRSLPDRRSGHPRRQLTLGPPGPLERRHLPDRRSGKDRRRHG